MTAGNASNDKGLSRRDFGRAAAGTTLAAAMPGGAAAQNAPATQISTNPESLRVHYQQNLHPEIVGTHGIVAAGRHYAVEAGIRTLLAGGNAFDAGAAAVFAASVTELSHFGFGGEAVAIIYDAKSKSVKTISGQGTAPGKATPEYFAPQGSIPGNGPNGGTLPAALDSIALLLANFGTMSLSQVMGPAIELADGYPMYGFLQDYFASQRTATERWEWSKSTYYPNGHLIEVGEMFCQPNLAKTLRTISDADRDTFAATNDRVKAIQVGRDTFYKGDIARRIAAAVQKDGGLMSYEDLANYQGHIEDPTHTTFYGYDVYKCGFWNQGPTLLMALNILEAADIRAKKPATDLYLHTIAETLKLAFDDRNMYFGDPRFASVPAEGLLSKSYGKSRAALIGSTASLEHRYGDPYAFQVAKRPPGPRFIPRVLKGPQRPSSDTTSIQIVDNKGNLFSCTPSSGWLSGGAYIAGDTGVPLSNRMTVFDLDPASPNVIAGGKRPRTTLSPTIIMKDGKPFLAIGTPGGDDQDQQQLQVLVDVLAFNMPLQQSIELPRISSDHFHNSFGLKQDHPGALEVEARFEATEIAKLKARGHIVKDVFPFSTSVGVVAAGYDPKFGTLRGGADIRRERIAFGW